MPPKTKTEDPITIAHAAAIARIDAATAEQALAAKAHAAAVAALADCYSPAEMAVLAEKVTHERERGLRAGLAIKAAQAAIPSTDTSLAAALAPLIGAVLGVPVELANSKPTEAPEVLPVAVIVQTTRRIADSIKGTIAGSVEVSLIRQGAHREMRTEAFDKRAQDFEVQFSARSKGSIDIGSDSDSDSGAATADIVHLDVRSAFEQTPIIRRGIDLSPMNFARALASQVTHQYGASFYAGRSTGGAPKRLVSVTQLQASTMSRQTDSSGLTRTKVRVSFDFSGQATVPQVDAFMRSRVGTCAAHFGRIVSAEVSSGPSSASHKGVSAVFTFESQLPAVQVEEAAA